MSHKRITFMLIVAIIGILAGSILLVSIERGRKTRFTSVVIPMRSAMTALVACLEGGNIVTNPQPSGGNQLCAVGNPAALWPVLQWNWTYDLAGSNFSNDCLIRINPNDGGQPVICSCQNQNCR